MSALLVAGCSFESFSAADPGGAGDESTGTTDGPDTDTPVGESGSAGSSSAASTTNSTTGPTTDSTDPSTSGPDETSGGTSTDPTGGIDVDIGCPEPLPSEWILCEDFEDIDNPSAHFSEWEGSGIGLGGPGLDSPTAFEVTHSPGEDWSGVAEVRFGEGPAANNVAQPGSQFDEVWVRFHTRVDEGWPVAGPGDVLEIEGVDQGGAATFMSRISATQYDPQLWGAAFSCVAYDYVYCDGIQDWLDLDWIGSQQGQSPVFAQPNAQEWTCVVVHARLNTPGAQDGMMEVLVGDTLDSQVFDLNYRGVRGDLGFNRIGMPTFIEQPLQGTHRRYIDDLVVSTASLDCDDVI